MKQSMTYRGIALDQYWILGLGSLVGGGIAFSLQETHDIRQELKARWETR
jgi:hypothetical protein